MTRNTCTDIWARMCHLFDSHTYRITPYGAVHGVIGINHRAYVDPTPEPNCVFQRVIDSEEGEEEVDSATGVFFFEDSDVALC